MGMVGDGGLERRVGEVGKAKGPRAGAFALGGQRWNFSRTSRL